MSSHGARSMVGSCVGGGVVASLMDGVGGSEEFDVEAWSMMFEERSMMLEQGV